MKKTMSAMISLVAVLSLAPVAGWAADRDTAGSTSKAKERGTGAGSTATSGSTGAAGTETAAKAPSKKLQEGLQKLHAANQAEIQGGQLAQKSASSSDVKSFGEKMVTDHTQNDQQLATIAQTMGASLEGKEFEKETKDAQKRMGDVTKKTGAEFDKNYMKLMVKDHEKDAKDVKKLAEEARKDGHTDLASFLDQTEQTMQGHLTTAKQIEKTVKNEKATASGKSSSSSSTGSGGASSK